jgi:hypothetical protein
MGVEGGVWECFILILYCYPYSSGGWQVAGVRNWNCNPATTCGNSGEKGLDCEG